MKALRFHKVIEKDGEIYVTRLPCKKGQPVELILLMETSTKAKRLPLTARRLLHSGLVGLWKGRKHIRDSAAFARRLREQAQVRQR
ncbi:hypothetical protein LM604_08200 [Candidatus Acetothermia bacterium]|jgi:hypothetical protein|nr:hypothetical protein [Candidatus Acetothermia bacterium]